MGVPLRVLIIEDSPEDAELLLRELRKGGYEPSPLRVETAEEMAAALAEGGWEIVIADYVLPGFSGLAALELLQQKGLDLPCIIVSGQMGEEAAVEAMKAGAHDYLVKGRLSRLAHVIRRELADAQVRHERRQTEEALREKLDFIQVLIDTIPTPIFYKDTQGGYLGCNKAFEKHVGLSREQIIGRTSFDIAPRDLAEVYQKKDMALLRDGGVQIYESSFACADGTRQDVMFYKAAFTAADGSLGGLVGAIFDITERKQAEVKLRYMSTHDSLTGLYNRSYFDEELVRLERSRKYPVSVIMVDVDGLKAVNDTMGHAAGDQLLQEAGQILKGVFRAEDVVARIGGDEFAILLPGADETATAEAMARIRQIIAFHNEDRETLPISLSMGAATTRNGVKLATVCRVADDRMYQDKLVRSGHAKAEMRDGE